MTKLTVDITGAEGTLAGFMGQDCSWMALCDEALGIGDKAKREDSVRRPWALGSEEAT